MYSDSPRSVFQRVLLCLFAAMAVIFAVWTLISRTHEGISFYETLLEIREENSQVVYSGKLYGDAVTIICREENGSKLVEFSAPGHYSASCRVEFPEGTITTEFGTEVGRIRIFRNDERLFSGGYDPEPDGNAYMKYFSENGEWDPFVTVSASGNGDPWYYFEFDAHDIMRFAMEPTPAARGSWPHYFAALFISAIGALLTAFPYALFYLKHALDVRDPEPTDFYLASQKAGGVILAVVALALYCTGVHTIVGS